LEGTTETRLLDTQGAQKKKKKKKAPPARKNAKKRSKSEKEEKPAMEKKANARPWGRRAGSLLTCPPRATAGETPGGQGAGVERRGVRHG